MTPTMLVTGAAGFIGANACSRFDEAGFDVVGVDDLSRRGSEVNAGWLRDHTGVELHRTDVRDRAAMREIVTSVDPAAVLHLAGQVAVTTSVERPAEDFSVNAEGTLRLLEVLRRSGTDAHLVFASTNKVYGDLGETEIVEREDRYDFADRPEGIGEDQPLSFHTPYGCSKGAADQYVLDYARTYGLRTTCLRQSCIYGPRQMGVEDQGWVAWFARAALEGAPITVFGDGKQVRDLLYVDDLVELFETILERPEATAGRAYNVGGGRPFTRSVLEVLGYLDGIVDRELDVSFDDWRPSDQRVFYCDNTKLRDEVGWRPSTPPREGIGRLVAWIESAESLPAVV